MSERDYADEIKKLEGSRVLTLEIRCTNGETLRYDCSVEPPEREGCVHLRLSGFDQHVNVPHSAITHHIDAIRNRTKLIVEKALRKDYPNKPNENHYLQESEKGS